MINVEDVKNAYIKIKNDIYYSNNVHYKKMIADFEIDSSFEIKFDNVVEIYNGDRSRLEKYINEIGIFSLPKSFLSEEDSKKKDKIAYGSSETEKIDSVNFFIKAPIEVFLLDALITLQLGEICYDKNKINKDSIYGNVLSSYKLFELKINNSTFFEPYFNKYSAWRNKAFSYIEKNNDVHDLVLINYDIKQFYYYCQVNFSELKEYLECENDEIFYILEKIYSKYKKELAVYKKIECTVDRYSLPIGLYSSKIISNICLSKYDNYVQNIIGDRGYYGRYVDDMIIVYPTMPNVFSENGEIKIKDVVENTFDFLEFDGEHFYIPNKYIKLIADSSEYKLMVNDDKIDCYYFKQGDSNTVSTIYKNKLLLKPSDIGYSIDQEVDEKYLVDNLYVYKNSKYLNKVSDLKSIFIDKYELSLMLTKLTNLFKNVDKTKNKKEIEQVAQLVLKCLGDSSGLKFYRQFEKIFNLLYVTNVDILKEYYNLMLLHVEKHIKFYNFSNKYNNNNNLEKLTIDNFKEYIKICYDLVLSNDSVTKNDNNKWIKSLMINKNIFNKPLYLFKSFSESDYIYDIDYNKVEYLPYWISLEEISLYFSIQHIFGQKKYYSYDEVIDFYCKLNKISRDNFVAPENIGTKLYDSDEFKTWIFEKTKNKGKNKIVQLLNQRVISKQGPKENAEDYDIRMKRQLSESCDYNEFNIGIVSMPIDEDVLITNSQNRTNQFDYKYKLKLFHILNEAIDSRVQHLVFPELSIPISWLKELMFYSKRHGIQITCGLQFIYDYKYKQKNTCIYNCIVSIYPYIVCGVYKLTYLDFREKMYYSPKEIEMFSENRLNYNKNNKGKRTIVKYRGASFTNALCYELTSLKDRASLLDSITNLFVPVLNKDTNYFSSIVDTAARELYCYVALSNTSYYGDSRITGPFSTVQKDYIRLKGGYNHYLAVSKVDIKRLLSARTGSFDDKEKQKSFKPLCAGARKKIK